MKISKSIIFVLILALVNCDGDTGRSNTNTDTEGDVLNDGKNATASANTIPDIAHTESESIPEPIEDKVESEETPKSPVIPEKTPDSQEKLEESDVKNDDVTNNDDNSKDDSEEPKAQEDKLIEGSPNKNVPTGTEKTEGEKLVEKPDEKPDVKQDEADNKEPETPVLPTEKSMSDITTKEKTTTTSSTTTTTNKITTSTTSTSTSTVTEENDFGEGENTYTDDEDITSEPNIHVDPESTSKKTTDKTQEFEPVKIIEGGDEAEFEQKYSNQQNYFMGGISAVFMVLIIIYYKKQSKGETTPNVRYQRIDENDEEMGVMIPRNDETTDDDEENDVWRWT